MNNSAQINQFKPQIQYIRGRHLEHKIVALVQPKRQNRVSRQVQRDLNSLFQQDQFLQRQICPELRQGLDIALSALVSVTQVKMSADLAYADVYVSIYSDDQGRVRAFQNLQKNTKYIRTQLSQQMVIKHVPLIRMYYDDTYDYAEDMDRVFDQIKQDDQMRNTQGSQNDYDFESSESPSNYSIQKLQKKFQGDEFYDDTEEDLDQDEGFDVSEEELTRQIKEAQLQLEENIDIKEYIKKNVNDDIMISNNVQNSYSQQLQQTQENVKQKPNLLERQDFRDGFIQNIQSKNLDDREGGSNFKQQRRKPQKGQKRYQKKK